jgi:hypothetical protein
MLHNKAIYFSLLSDLHMFTLYHLNFSIDLEYDQFQNFLKKAKKHKQTIQYILFLLFGFFVLHQNFFLETRIFGLY